MTKPSVGDYLNSVDPVIKEVAEFLVEYKEEDDCIDYKETFDPASDRDWLEITKDVSAFANTFGGYLVFGVKDKTREAVGLGMKLAEALEDVNNIQQKLNRYLEPQISKLRSKKFRVNGKLIVLVYIPLSKGITHLISKDGAFAYPSGEKKIVLRKGTFYVRRSAANHLGDTRDLDAVIERRIDQFRAALIDKVARVVKSPINSEVFILSPDPEDEEAKKFIIEDAPESIPIKGMSFTVPPEGPVQEIAAWSVLSQSDSSAMPPQKKVWEWYSIRQRLKLTPRQRLSVFRFALWRDVPSFYWIRGLQTQDIQDSLIDAIRMRPNNECVRSMLMVASFIGKGFYSKALQSLGSYRDRLAPVQKSFPANGPETQYFKFRKGKDQRNAELRTKKLNELHEIVEAVVNSNSKPPLPKQWNAQDIDCFLYAQLDQYREQ
jgi:hypothetical protein